MELFTKTAVLRIALIFFFSAIFSITVLVFFYISYTRNQNNLYETYAQNVSVIIQNYNKTQFGLLNEIALREDICIPNSVMQADSLQNAAMRINYSSLIIAVSDVDYVYSGDDIASIVFQNSGVSDIIKNGNGSFVDFLKIDSSFFLLYAVPVFFSDESDGTLIAVKSLHEIEALLDEIKIPAAERRGIFVLPESCTSGLIPSVTPQSGGVLNPTARIKTVDDASIYISNLSGDIIFKPDDDTNKDMFIVSNKIAKSPWTLHFRAKNNLGYAALYFKKSIFIFAVLFFVIASLLLRACIKSPNKKADDVSEINASYIDDTMKDIINVVNAIKEESAALEKAGQVIENNLNNELGKLQSIASRISSTKEQAEREENSAAYASDFINLIFKNAASLNKEFEKQTVNMEKIEPFSRQINVIINDLANDITHNSNDLKKIIKESSAAKNEAEEFNINVKHITGESEDILQVMRALQSLSNEINLLSMNASIESVRGSGDGFMIVAKEIRKSAESVTLKIKTISTQLRKIMPLIDGLASSAERVSEKCAAIDCGINVVQARTELLKVVIDKQGEISATLINAIGETQIVLGIMKNGLQEFSDSADYIKSETSYLRFLTFDTKGLIEDVLSKTDSIRLSISNIHKLTIANVEKMDMLNTEISRLKIGEMR
ncbi:MAG: hypothetical protein Ta2B_29720 [Termitinemataceae bacterium]|nr:MAG: hypothetical protein Ta2B_29720 [Termitinemataceae bacterium]